MPKGGEYWVAFDLPETIRKEVEGARTILNEFGISTSSTPPHITIKGPFVSQGLAPSRVLETIHAEVLKKTEAVFGSLASFDNPGGKVLYLPVVTVGLYSITRHIIDRFKLFGVEPTEWDGKTLHTTIAKGLSDDEFVSAREALEHIELPSGPFVVESFTLYREEDGKSISVRQYQLS